MLYITLVLNNLTGIYVANVIKSPKKSSKHKNEDFFYYFDFKTNKIKYVKVICRLYSKKMLK